MNAAENDIHFESNIEVKYLSINHSVPLGIIFNELITNSIKYGFSNGYENHMQITVTPTDDMIHVTYEDNGPGIENFDEASSKSLGFSLINSLLTQIDAEYSYETDEQFKLSFSFKDESSQLFSAA